jgi:hypothetical protein
MHTTLDQRILGITTIINSTLSIETESEHRVISSQGSGFFYSEIEKNATGPINEEKGLGWHEVLGTWLVTNRHVVFIKIKTQDGKIEEVLPDSFTFNLREVVDDKIN